jgi:Domain of unknown function DUF11
MPRVSWITSCLWLLLGGLSASAHAVNEVPVPADIQITFTAKPTDHLVPGDSVQATLTMTNLGPKSVQQLIVESGHYVNEFYFTSFDCQHVGLIVEDFANGYDYLTVWYAVNAINAQTTELDVGQSLTCHMTLVLTHAAPLSYTVSFGLPNDYIDINRANDTSSITLRRAIPAVPATNSWSLAVLVLLTAGIASKHLRWQVRRDQSQA